MTTNLVNYARALKSSAALEEKLNSHEPLHQLPEIVMPDDLNKTSKLSKGIVLVLFSGVLLSSVVEVPKAVSAAGELKPMSKIKAIQHLEGGIVREILVKEGQYVKENDPLIVLDLATSGINKPQLESQVSSLSATIDRLSAEVEGKPYAKSKSKLNSADEKTSAEKQIFDARNYDIAAQQAVIRQKVERFRSDKAALEQELSGLMQQKQIAQEELSIVSKLYSENLVGALELLDKKNRYLDIDSKLNQQREKISIKSSEIAELVHAAEQVGKNFKRQAADELLKLATERSSSLEKLSLAQEQENRATIRSPINGIVKGLTVSSTSSVVSKGEPIMNIVPSEDKLVAHVKVAPSDRGFIKEGQKVELKFTAFDYVKFGSGTGKVSAISADTVQDLGGTRLEAEATESAIKTKEPHFLVKVELDPLNPALISKINEYTNNSEDNPLKPGMLLTADIIVGYQSFISYLFKPVLKLKQ